MAEPLHVLAQTIQREIDLLPPVDPLTLSSSAGEQDERILRIIGRVCSRHDSRSSSRIESEYFGTGPLEPLLSDEAVTEIIVNGSESIWFEKYGRLQRFDDCFLSALTFRNFINRVSREAGFHANLDCPFADGKWRGSRVHLILPPASGRETVLTIRKHPNSAWTLSLLKERDWASNEAFEILKRLLSEKRNILVVGGTGSGKTSVLAACLTALAADERALMIEDTDELPVPNAISSKLLTRKDFNGLLKEIDQSELVRQSLRMRPDRIVMGEIRGGEAKDLLMAFATGHSGCLGTLHADSARQALLRLEMLVQIGAPQWSLQTVRTLILLSVHALIVVGRQTDGSRKLVGIHRVASLEDTGFLLERMV